MLKPLPVKKWNFTTAAHLLNRAGFGGPPAEIDKLVDLGLDKAVTQLVDYENIPDPTPNPDWAKPDPNRAQKFKELRESTPEQRKKLQQAERQMQQQQITELRGWWLQRMAKGPRPLQEKMTLFWHGHFATSVEKVRDAYLMWRQNELFRRLVTGDWLDMLVRVAQDPAMLIWLDQAQSRKEHPNENFAREVMELFALGEGHYSEKDISEAARALTGWSYDRIKQRFVERPNVHDDGEKTVLGRTGNLDGKEFLEQVVAQPQSARFITAKIWNFFAGQPASDELVTAMADVFRKANNNFKPLLHALFRSEEFYSDNIIRNQVKSPVQWLVGSVRVLERELPPPVVCFSLTRNLGQDLFAPPNVKGWDGGLSWITTNNLLARYNESAMLVLGDKSMLAGLSFGKAKAPMKRQQQMQRRLENLPLVTVSPEKILTAEERKNKDALIAALEKRLLQGKLKEKQEKVLHEFLDSQGALDDQVVLEAVRLIMSTPEYQLT
ncbi:MAG: DUF1800 domain-containing protein [Verrucomicrobia bacterium]|nr:DUF1800 domain-containing protein [Verrucomicrobiota bacterium]